MDIDELRQKIDSVDEQLVSLLSNRAKLAMEIAKVKQQANTSTFVPSRERQVIDRVMTLNQGPLPAESLRVIYEQIIAACRMLESPVAVAYLGPPGTWCHMAASRKFGPGATLMPSATVEDVFLAVEKKSVDFGVVPVENSIAGMERTTLDRFVGSSVQVCAECYVEIKHNLTAQCSLGEIKRIYSHPQALDQCRGWLRANLAEAETIEVSSTSRAAQLASEQSGSAAIGTELAAEIYGLTVVAAGIQDRPDNRTRFLIIGKESAQPSGKDKTSLMFSVPHRVGSLWEVLGVFHEHKINLNMIESRPTKQTPWEYVFFADAQGHATQEPLAGAIKALAAHTLFVTVLGSYPEAE